MAPGQVSLGDGRQITDIADISATVSFKDVCMVRLGILVLACCFAKRFGGMTGKMTETHRPKMIHKDCSGVKHAK